MAHRGGSTLQNSNNDNSSQLMVNKRESAMRLNDALNKDIINLEIDNGSIDNRQRKPVINEDPESENEEDKVFQHGTEF